MNATPTVESSAEELAAYLKNDRLNRRMTWEQYAKFTGVSHAAIYKLSRGVTKRPHQRTVKQILDRILQPA